MWRNDIKCKYMFRLTLNNLACKGLNQMTSNFGVILNSIEIWLMGQAPGMHNGLLLP